VGATGSLTGYGGGLSRKQYLLDFEHRNALMAGRRGA
jgi:methylated-DNA-[protein]-cysteine S-methyltransferase